MRKTDLWASWYAIGKTTALRRHWKRTGDTQTDKLNEQALLSKKELDMLLSCSRLESCRHVCALVVCKFLSAWGDAVLPTFRFFCI